MKNRDIPSAYIEAVHAKALEDLHNANDWYSRALAARSGRVRKIFCIMGDRSIARADILRDQLDKIIIVRPSRN